MSQDPQAAPTEYEIRVSGSLDPERTEWFGGLALVTEHTEGGNTITVLSGPVADRAALFGILGRIRDLGLALISVNPTAPEKRGAAGGEMQQEDRECE